MKIFCFPLEIEIDEDNVFVDSCPMFKGCHAAGKTIDEALMDLEEAIELCLLD
ncbi:type II toxin-antitoxin system HicB family antitoxin [Mucilaginibacter flavidus]|uniref:type II toxin-antitoxin system HicB family antitoxin n=1 Tax=Mucilaginibacter flavidus TaxID=2949309 RepID=UPI002093C928|nr:type II toxin-antitoxin system HicB family antitoxin [Mucilaginibacter flavidus]MCO5945930.1 type II toxin-antitoxin system HicB family antitoxin [Mucilaginibacter flavidus]